MLMTTKMIARRITTPHTAAAITMIMMVSDDEGAVAVTKIDR